MRTSPINFSTVIRTMSYKLLTPVPYKVVTSKETTIEHTTVYFSSDIPTPQPKYRHSSPPYRRAKPPQPSQASEPAVYSNKPSKPNCKPTASTQAKKPAVCSNKPSKTHCKPTADNKATTDQSTQTTPHYRKVSFHCDC